jgi:hypothetical protein
MKDKYTLTPQIARLSKAAAVASLALFAAISLAPATALADRGGGSIRGAGRSAPAPRAPEAPHEAPREAPHPAPDVHPDNRAPDNHPPDVHPDDAHPDNHPAPAPARRDWDDNDDDAAHWGGYAHGTPVHIARGQRFHDLPHDHFQVHFNNIDYFYDDTGAFYQLGPDGQYVIVQPPVGADITAVPDGATQIAVGPTTYDYLDGIFYIQQDNGFAVVNPPPGIVVPYLPSGANTVDVDGNVVYQFNGFNYAPSIQDGVTVYTVTPM